MKHTFVAGWSIALAILAASCPASEFDDRYADLSATDGNEVEIERLLDSSRIAEAGNPGYYIAVANHFFAKSRSGVVLSRKPAADGDVALSDPATGEAVGSIAAAGPDPESMGRAIAALVEAVARFPDRLDIRIGLAHLQHEAGDHPGQLATLTAAADRAVSAGAALRWREGGELPAPAGRFVPGILQDCAAEHFAEETPAADERFLAIATVAMTRFPRHPHAYNSVAAYWYRKADLAKARDHLAKAHACDPRDQLVVYNLGFMALKAGDRDAARTWLGQVIASDADEELKDQARATLEDAGK